MRVRVWHRCEDGCGPWPVSMVKELGSLFYRDDDNAFCPHCGRVGALMDVPEKIKEDDHANHD